MDEIADLTDEQIAFLVQDPDAPAGRKVDGVTIHGSWPSTTFATFAAAYRAYGWTDEAIEEAWQRDYPDKPME